MPDTSPAPPRRGLLRRGGAALWRLIDGARRIAVNLLFVAIVAALALGWWKSRPPPLLERTALVLALSGALVDQRAVPSRGALLEGAAAGNSLGAQVVLGDVLRALDAADDDPRITTVLLLPEDLSSAGMADLREVAAALRRVRAHGKKVVAWASNYDQRQYLLAAQADEVYLDPMGMVQLSGFGTLRNYYRDAFDRLGVAANVIRIGQYKNFGEPYVANAPSPQTLAEDAGIYDELWSTLTGELERARKLAPGSIARGIDELPQRLAAANGSAAQMALDAHLVDGLKTRDQLRALMIARGARDDETRTFRQIGLDGWLAQLPPEPTDAPVALIVAEGAISDGEAPPGAIGGRSTAALIRSAREDDTVKALVLRVRSPGGSAYGAELIRRELELTRAAGKPVVVSMGDVAASGGYWITMSADEVIADPTTITGSIGVFAMLPTADGLLAKLPVHTGGYATTWLKNAYDPRKPLDPRFASLVQTAIGRIYLDFTTLAAKARHKTQPEIDAVAQGRVWTGRQALARGLVDRNGGLADAVQAARRRAGLPANAAVRTFELPTGRLQRLLDWFGPAGVEAQQWWLAREAEAARAALPPGLPPELAAQLRGDLAWLAATATGRQPFGAYVHCLCGPP